MDKKLFRKEVKQFLQKTLEPKNIYNQHSAAIAEQVYRDKDWNSALCIGITLSNFPEADTYEVIKRAWKDGKKVAVPKCYPEKRVLEFHELLSFDQLETVYYGLKEPIISETRRVPCNEMDLLFVPGLAFSPNGYRLGYGGGYYDRFLAAYKGKTLSLAFDAQILPEIPVESHDIPVSKIITPSEVIRCV
ncbi:5-formyltetrahydrofolate cyclo-ligase [Peribacillus deserti]|uniref:5-formyltetrahydrofolate cyclo-ligase n=1 Tax=Peribacillus deserti TaxID=673318 RepID=A0ABS2QJG1_9BACI|nr:5-formyltetrahydrofolate cyclo-ligase [Peribacillus deserti]MBM7693301.1 5-formyltetrahydrofolate cyclo-ligase [Peribacillus deserti]